MSAPFQGFIGPSYTLANRYAAVERTVNWLLVANEAISEEKKFSFGFELAPGNQPFGILPVPGPFNQPCRGLIENRGMVFGVNGSVAFAMSQSGAYSNLGLVANDFKPVSMVANGTGQVFIASAGFGYVIGGVPPHMDPITSTDFLGASYATFQDGYILVVTPNSNQFQISGTDDVPLGDATLWSAANISIQAGQADLLKAIISSREYIRLCGDRRSQVYYNVGANGIGAFPFQSYNETFIETGIAAAFSLANMGDSLIWIGQDSRGQRACWRDATFQPTRISTFAVEQLWQSYARIDDAVAFAYIWEGHLIYRITFPSAALSGPVRSATWEYDATVSALVQRPIWTERSFLPSGGELTGRPELYHCFAYDRHLVASSGGDRNPGAVYQMAGAPLTDCAMDQAGDQVQQPIVRDRICPHQWVDNKRRIYNRIEFEGARGSGLDGSPTVGADPQILLRWSNDGGWTYGPEYNIPAGRIGQYGIRHYWNRCGYARDRVFWHRYTDPAYYAMTGAELDVTECAS